VKADEREALKWITQEFLTPATDDSDTHQSLSKKRALNPALATPKPSGKGSEMYGWDFNEEMFENNAKLNEVSEEGVNVIDAIRKFEENEKIVMAMEKWRMWSFDVFEVKSLVGELTLPFLMMRVFHDLGFQSSLGISETVFANYMQSLTKLYFDPEEVCYHNQFHASDVLETHYYFMRSDVFTNCSELDKFASLVAAAAPPALQN